jgi:hypothetical protein
MQDTNLTYDQQQIFKHLTSSMLGIYFLEWTPRSEKQKIKKQFNQTPLNIGEKSSFGSNN